MAAGISTRSRATMEKSSLFVEVESLCGATGYPFRTPRLEDTVLDAHTREPITVITHSRGAVRERLARKNVRVFPSNGTGKRSRLCTAGWERDGKAGRQTADGMGWELTISRWDGNGREIKRSGNKSGNWSGNKSGNKLGNKSGNTSGNTSACREDRNRFVAFITTAVFYVPCMCDSGIQGHTNGSTRTCTSSKNNIMATNVTACV